MRGSPNLLLLQMASKDIVAIVLAEQILDLKNQLHAKNEEIAMMLKTIKKNTGNVIACAAAPASSGPKPKSSLKKKADTSYKKSSKKVKFDGTPDMRTTEGRALAAAMQLSGASSDESGNESNDETNDVAAAQALVTAWAPAPVDVASAAPADAAPFDAAATQPDVAVGNAAHTA